VPTKTRTAARIRIDVNSNNGVVKKSVTAKVGDDLYRLANQREIYRDGFIIDEIDVANECVSLTNGTVLYVGDTQGGMTDEIMRFQIQKTVEEHFKKEHKHKGKGIKTLSLFLLTRLQTTENMMRQAILSRAGLHNGLRKYTTKWQTSPPLKV